jgi:hypothetical protein
MSPAGVWLTTIFTPAGHGQVSIYAVSGTAILIRQLHAPLRSPSRQQLPRMRPSLPTFLASVLIRVVAAAFPFVIVRTEGLPMPWLVPLQ